MSDELSFDQKPCFPTLRGPLGPFIGHFVLSGGESWCLNAWRPVVTKITAEQQMEQKRLLRLFAGTNFFVHCCYCALRRLMCRKIVQRASLVRYPSHKLHGGEKLGISYWKVPACSAATMRPEMQTWPNPVKKWIGTFQCVDEFRRCVSTARDMLYRNAPLLPTFLLLRWKSFVPGLHVALHEKGVDNRSTCYWNS